MTDTATVDEAVAPVIAEEMLRDVAIRLDPFIAIGQSPPTDLARSGFMADLVDELGYDAVLAKYPEAAAFVGRLRETLEGLVGAA